MHWKDERDILNASTKCCWEVPRHTYFFTSSLILIFFEFRVFLKVVFPRRSCVVFPVVRLLETVSLSLISHTNLQLTGTDPVEIARARNEFYHGKRRVMLMSGRFYFFRRYRIRGTRHVVFYTPPKIPQFYADIVNSMSSSSLNDSTAENSVKVIFDI